LNKPETTPPTYFHHFRDGTKSFFETDNATSAQEKKWKVAVIHLWVRLSCSGFAKPLGLQFGATSLAADHCNRPIPHRECRRVGVA